MLGSRFRFSRILKMSIYDQVLAFIAAPDPSRFETLALEVFRYQFANVAGVSRTLPRGRRARGVGRQLDDIPPVSTIAFKYARLAGTERGPAEKDLSHQWHYHRT